MMLCQTFPQTFGSTGPSFFILKSAQRQSTIRLQSERSEPTLEVTVCDIQSIKDTMTLPPRGNSANRCRTAANIRRVKAESFKAAKMRSWSLRLGACD